MKIDKKTVIQLFKYGIISLFGYLFVFGSLYVLIDMLKMNKAFSFGLVYGISYILLYSIQLKLLFKKKHETKKFIRFLGTLLFFYLLANLGFYIFNSFEINYLISTALTIIILMPLRFLVSKFFVFDA